MTSLARATTRSPRAFGAYLQGEKHFRNRNWPKAVESYREATTADTSFALAFYKLAESAAWLTYERETALAAAREAVRLSDSLPPAVRLLSGALVSQLEGDADEAEAAYRRVLRSYPDDPETWSRLAGLLWASNYPRSRSNAEAYAILDPLHALKPDHSMIRLMSEFRFLKEGRVDRLDSLYATFTSERELDLYRRAIRAFVSADPSARKKVTTELRRAEYSVIIGALARVRTFPNNLANNRELAGLLVEPTRRTSVQTYGNLNLAYLHAAGGQLREARDYMKKLRSQYRPWALVYEALLFAMPFFESAPDDVDSMIASLSQWDPESDGPMRLPGQGFSFYFDVHDDVNAHLRLYLLGLLNARAGRESQALQYARDLEVLPSPEGKGAVSTDLALGVRAAIAQHNGRFDDALELLDQMRRKPVGGWSYHSPFLVQGYEHYARACLLERFERFDEALDAFASSDESAHNNIVYDAPASLHQARIYDRLGSYDKAAERYRHFVAMWRDCDPELEPLVEKARRALEEAVAKAAS